MLNFLTTNKILKVQVTMQRSTFIVLIYLKRILRWIRKTSLSCAPYKFFNHYHLYSWFRSLSLPIVPSQLQWFSLSMQNFSYCIQKHQNQKKSAPPNHKWLSMAHPYIYFILHFNTTLTIRKTESTLFA